MRYGSSRLEDRSGAAIATALDRGGSGCARLPGRVAFVWTGRRMTVESFGEAANRRPA